jgi:hypothetical protein
MRRPFFVAIGKGEAFGMSKSEIVGQKRVDGVGASAADARGDVIGNAYTLHWQKNGNSRTGEKISNQITVPLL